MLRVRLLDCRISDTGGKSAFLLRTSSTGVDVHGLIRSTIPRGLRPGVTFLLAVVAGVFPRILAALGGVFTADTFVALIFVVAFTFSTFFPDEITGVLIERAGVFFTAGVLFAATVGVLGLAAGVFFVTTGVAGFFATTGVDFFAKTGVAVFLTTAGVDFFVTTGVALFLVTTGVATFFGTVGVAVFFATTGVAVFFATTGVAVFGVFVCLAGVAPLLGVLKAGVFGVALLAIFLTAAFGVDFTPVGVLNEVGVLGEALDLDKASLTGVLGYVFLVELSFGTPVIRTWLVGEAGTGVLTREIRGLILRAATRPLALGDFPLVGVFIFFAGD